MGKDLNDHFRDCIDKINNIAKSKGWKNGADWAAFAVKVHLISESMKVDYDNCHELRNSMSHGNAKNIIVHQATYSTAREFLRIIEAKIRDNKGNKKSQKFNNTTNDRRRELSIDRNSRSPVLSNAEIAYLGDILNKVLKHYVADYFIVDVCFNIFSRFNQNHSLHEIQGLLVVLKTTLFLRFREHNDDRAGRYCSLLDNFIQT